MLHEIDKIIIEFGEQVEVEGWRQKLKTYMTIVSFVL